MAESINDGGAAFPMCFGPNDLRSAKGMYLRDYFAAKAMQGDWASQSGDTGFFTSDTSDETFACFARMYYRMADAMIAAKDTRHD